MGRPLPTLQFLAPAHWADYELLDSGGGAKLERFGSYSFVRPEPQAYWTRRDPKRNGLQRMACSFPAAMTTRAVGSLSIPCRRTGN